MIIAFETPIGKKRANLEEPINISLPLRNGVHNPNCYRAEDPLFETIEMGDFVGDVKRGGSVNYKKISITPHGNGTHTECYGHISPEDAFINQTLRQFHFLAELISVPISAVDGDRIMKYEDYIQPRKFDFVPAVIIRSLPNIEAKKTMKYSETNPPYFEPKIMLHLRESGVDHLITDLPSVDPERDRGRLSAHKEFWNIPRSVRKESTITELAFIPNEVEDGLYFLHLQIPNLELDAAPSNPTLYKIY